MSEENPKNPMDLNGDGEVSVGEALHYAAKKATEEVKEAYSEAKENAKEFYDKTAPKVKEAYNEVKENAKTKWQDLKDKKQHQESEE